MINAKKKSLSIKLTVEKHSLNLLDKKTYNLYFPLFDIKNKMFQYLDQLGLPKWFLFAIFQNKKGENYCNNIFFSIGSLHTFP